MGYERIWRLAFRKDSRLILALDYYENPYLVKRLEERLKRSIFKKAEGILSLLKECVVGVKIGFPLTLIIGFDGIAELISKFKEEYYFIADYKLSDIPKVVNHVALTLKSIGFNGLISHAFQGGLSEAFSRLIDSVDIYTIIMMSHEGFRFKDKFRELLKESINAGVRGFIVGATKPRYISEVKSAAPNSTILSPGVITQGAKPSIALRSGGDFEIIGRAITYSKDPLRVAKEVVEAERNALNP